MTVLKTVQKYYVTVVPYMCMLLYDGVKDRAEVLCNSSVLCLYTSSQKFKIE